MRWDRVVSGINMLHTPRAGSRVLQQVSSNTKVYIDLLSQHFTKLYNYPLQLNTFIITTV